MLLHQRGWQVSTSMVGRILTSLKARGVLREPLRSGISVRKRLWRRSHAVRKPMGYAVKGPGDPDCIGVDTLDVRPLPGCPDASGFTARDVISRWDVVEVHTRATATTAKAFLNALQGRMPFPVHALQVDGGSEFLPLAGLRRHVSSGASSSLSCRLAPPSLERAQRTHTEEILHV